MTRNNPERGAARKSNEALERRRELERERSDTLRFEFVASELDLAVTFCESATSTSDPERSKRNLAQAEKAYESAKHFLDGQHLIEPMRRTIEGKVSVLESALKKAQEKKERKAGR